MHAYTQTLPTIHLHEMQRYTNVRVHLSVCTFIYSVEIMRLLHPGLSLAFPISCFMSFLRSQEPLFPVAIYLVVCLILKYISNSFRIALVKTLRLQFFTHKCGPRTYTVFCSQFTWPLPSPFIPFFLLHCCGCVYPQNLIRFIYFQLWFPLPYIPACLSLFFKYAEC